MNAKKLLSLGFALSLFATMIACNADQPNELHPVTPDTVVSPGGGVPEGKLPVGGACTDDDQCDVGLWCDTGLCLDPSDPVQPGQCEGTGCVDGYECDTSDHQCHLKLEPVDPQLEQDCTTSADCQAGYACVAGECLPPLPPAVQKDPDIPFNPFTAIKPIFITEPKVVATTPTDAATGVSTIPTISVTFNTAMDAESVKQHLKLYVFDVLFELPVEGYVSGDEKTFTYTAVASELHPQPIKKNALYEIRVEAGVKTKWGTPMADEFHSGFMTHN